MSAIELIKEKLQKYPQVKYRVEDNLINILPVDESGFTVSLEEQNSEYTVFFEGWHERFASKEEALDCIAFALSDSCRLVEISRGGKPHKWIVEYLDNGAWETYSETGLLMSNFWEKKTKKVYRNNIINTDNET